MSLVLHFMMDSKSIFWPTSISCVVNFFVWLFMYPFISIMSQPPGITPIVNERWKVPCITKLKQVHFGWVSGTKFWENSTNFKYRKDILFSCQNQYYLNTPYSYMHAQCLTGWTYLFYPLLYVIRCTPSNRRIQFHSYFSQISDNQNLYRY